MKLSASLAKKLYQLTQKGSLSYSTFTNKEKLKELIGFGIIQVKSRGQNRKVILLSHEKLANYLLKLYGIESLETYIETSSNANRSRASIAQVSNDTKSFSSSVQKGLYIASYEPINIQVDSQNIVLNTPSSSAM